MMLTRLTPENQAFYEQMLAAYLDEETARHPDGIDGKALRLAVHPRAVALLKALYEEQDRQVAEHAAALFASLESDGGVA